MCVLADDYIGSGTFFCLIFLKIRGLGWEPCWCLWKPLGLGNGREKKVLLLSACGKRQGWVRKGFSFPWSEININSGNVEIISGP